MFKKQKLVEAPLGYWEEKSYMLAIPKKEENDEILKKSLERIASIKGVKIKGNHYDREKNLFYVTIIYEKEEYEIGFYVGDVSIPDYYLNKNYLFKEEEKELLLNAKRALTLFMKFHNHPKKDYHLQIKLAYAMVPDLIGVMDESAENVLPKKWVELSAKSSVEPSAKDLFLVQAVSEEKGSVWLHTHGLCRCGITELEILDSKNENYQNHYNLIATYAMYLIDKKSEVDPRNNGAYIGRLINGYPVVVTCKSWIEGLKEYKKIDLGGEKDRQSGHNSWTSIVFLYKSEKDEEKGKVSKITDYNQLWGDNPIFFISNEETSRMKALAIERFNYVKESFKNKENKILIKVGLPLEEKGQFEHIWFELLELKENKFKAKLTQEPYDVKDLHTGDEAWYTTQEITDWIIYTKDFAVNPNNAYLLEIEKETKRK
ncbi:MAG: DUF4026 domain-containing protein [Bacilli bacterium]|jgi:hypothetical protein|nr:DUF4026 domain-containing protein [Bacilli bacterium]